MKNIFILIGMFAMPLAQADDFGPHAYYRIWQGFKKADLSETDFMAVLPLFMNQTTQLYMEREHIGRNYLVPIPPQGKPDFVPDEFALVSLNSEAEYRRVRATPEGIAYSNSHWDVFDRTRSASAPYKTGLENLPETLVNNEAYDLIGDAIDWELGYTTFFIGLRKDEMTPETFLARLSSNVRQTTEVFQPMGLRGYLVIANENYAAAYTNWGSQMDALTAVMSEPGQAVIQDAKNLMVRLYAPNLSIFDGVKVEAGKFYSTRR